MPTVRGTATRTIMYHTLRRLNADSVARRSLLTSPNLGPGVANCAVGPVHGWGVFRWQGKNEVIHA